jgi:outer membrane protein OmpA-like peptidoglycan-associated protein
MSMLRIILTMACLLLAGCASKGTTVILLEDLDGTTGQVRVANAAGEQRLDTARQSTRVADASTGPTEAAVVAEDEVEKNFGPVLAAMPDPPRRFILYFEPGTTTLTPESLSMPPSIQAAIRERNSRDVRVNGHTDRVGTRDFNMRLSRERAGQIRDFLVGEGTDPSIIRVYPHGEGNPLVPTPDEVPEPKNRRVEVLVR